MALWNGHNGAISLTFDDGLPCQIGYALPAMDERGIPGTFFLIKNSPYDKEFRRETWLRAIEYGHEVGSHSVNHRKAAELTPREAIDECVGSRNFLESELGAPINSFCYPYTDAPQHLQSAVRQTYKQARGGRGARHDHHIVSGDGVNLYNMPCEHVGGTSWPDIDKWVAEALRRKAWVTLMFHGVGPDETQWDNISALRFKYVLDVIAEARDNSGLWVGTFGDVAENLRLSGGVRA